VTRLGAKPVLHRAELVALLSLGTDLGLGQPMEHMIRASVLALRLADDLGLNEAERRVVYYSGLLAWVGCHTDAYEQAKWLGDDLLLKSDAHYAYDAGRPGPAAAMLLKHIGGAGRPWMERIALGLKFFGEGRHALAQMAENHYRATDHLAAALGLGEDVRVGLSQTYERWDGKGALGLRGEESVISARLINLTDVVEVFRRTGGADAAIAVARERSGAQFDPGLVDLFCRRAPDLFRELDAAPGWQTVMELEPSLGEAVAEVDLDRYLSAIGDFAELKSPWLLGHSRGVAELAADAAAGEGLPATQVIELRRAGYLLDIGRLGVPNTIWDKRGPLTQAEMERVRLHPYLTERMLSYSEALASLGAIAIQHHERLDGSGYPHGSAGASITLPAQILAAADVYQAMTEARPHRAARSPEAAAAELKAEVTRGRIGGDAVAAVLQAAGHRVGRRRGHPAGLTAREVEVLRLLTLGLSNKEIAQRLFISPKTAGSHVENIYGKIEAGNRAQAGLFAMRHGLIVEASFE